MYKIRQASCNLFLVILLFLSSISAPLVVLAEESTNNVLSQEVSLFKTKEEIVVDGKVTISPETYLYGRVKSEQPESVFIQFGSKEIEVSSIQLSLIDYAEKAPIFQEYGEEAVEIVIPANQELTSVSHTESIVTFLEEATYPVIQRQDDVFMYVGNVAFALDSVQDFEPEPGSDLEESKENNEVPPNNVVEEQSPVNEEEKVNTEDDELDSENKSKNEVEEKQGMEEEKATLQEENPWETSNADFFKVTVDNLTIYDNRTGELVKIGELSKNQIYPRVSAYGPNWHRIQFGNIYGYVSTKFTEIASGSDLENINTSYSNQDRMIIPLEDVPVYDNASGSLVQFGTLQQGVQYPIVNEYGNWWRVVLSDRVGYVHVNSVKAQFQSSDKYFRVIEDNLPIYDNRTGKLIKVGELTKGQVYPRISSYGPNWHRIQYGSIYGYVLASSTEPTTGEKLKNETDNYTLLEREITPINDTPVYDNTTQGKLIEFAKLEAGKSYPKVADYGNWWRVVVAGREGYVSKSQVKHNFLPGDNYFKVITDDLPVYDNRGNDLKKIGELQKGQTYPIVSNYGNWWRIQFGDIYGYVHKNGTEYGIKSSIGNLNTSFTNSKNTRIKTNQKTVIYDNTSGKLVPFGELEEGVIYPIATDYGNWWRIIYSDRIGYISKSSVEIFGWNYENYNITIQNAVSKQMNVRPQTDIYYGEIYVRYDAFVKGTLDLNKLTGVLESGWNVRSGPGTEHEILYLSKSDRNVRLVDAGEYKDKNGDVWRKLTRSSLPTWINATRDAVEYNMDSSNFINDPVQKFQFLDLRHYTGIPVSELDGLLSGKGTLHGMGAVFAQAAQSAKINELYLVSHAILETGNGTSELARGVKVNGKTVYNLFGINAYDHCAVECGAQKAYDEGWFTVEAAILGGAEFAKSNYIYAGQNTLYKMRWNPQALESGGPSHQYATDIGWARKQVNYYHSFYSKGTYNLYFEVPVFK